MLASLRQAQALGALARQLRCFSAATGDVVDEMVSYSRANFRVSKTCGRRASGFWRRPDPLPAPRAPQTNREQAIDVLKSGLQYMDTGAGAGRRAAATAAAACRCRRLLPREPRRLRPPCADCCQPNMRDT